jgi:hypothetical protein
MDLEVGREALQTFGNSALSAVSLINERRDNGYAGFRHGLARDLILPIFIVCAFES